MGRTCASGAGHITCCMEAVPEKTEAVRMKLVKWLLGTLVVLVLVIGVGVAALVYLVDWNDFKDTIQNQVKKQTGRDLTIAGDLSPRCFRGLVSP